MKTNNTVIIIPSRLSAVRLPNKPLARIRGKPMILWVVEQALKSGLSDVYVACCDSELADLLEKNNYNYVMTDPDLPTGTDRVHAALEALDKDYDFIINLQGDLPFISPEIITATHKVLISSDTDISTAAYLIKNHEENKLDNPNVVKAVLSYKNKALYFSRACRGPYGGGEVYEHIGIYGYTRDALCKFVKLEQTPIERYEKLEQLRAMENDMNIHVAIVDDVPISIDTEDDLRIARELLKI